MRSSDKKCSWYRSLVLDTTLSFLLSRSSNVTPFLNLRRLTFNVKVRRDIRNFVAIITHQEQLEHLVIKCAASAKYKW